MSVQRFPIGLPTAQWQQFPAAGFDVHACGIIHRDASTPAVCGMPLGGIDTGCIDLETSGMWGYSTIFNSHVPRSGPLNVPVFGLAVGEDVWVLSTLRSKAGSKEHVVIADKTDELAASQHLSIEGVKSAQDVAYWGHYPIADLEFETDAPISVGIRAWTPFIPGDVEASMTPGAVFEVQLRNTSDTAQTGAFVLNFPGPSPKEMFGGQLIKEELNGPINGVCLGMPSASYVLGVIGEAARCGGSLGTDSAQWQTMASALPHLAICPDFGAAVAVDFTLAPGEEKVVRYLLAWHSPKWHAAGNPSAEPSGQMWGEVWIPRELPAFTHMSATRWQSAQQVADYLAANHNGLLSRIIAWQQAIYTEESLPVWLRESLVNIFHLIAEDGMWAAQDGALPAWVKPEDGLFGMNESPRDCPQIECIPCSWYGNIPLVYFFPQLALSTLRGYKGYQDAEGCPPWIFGGITMWSEYCGFTKPARGYQVAMNPAEYVDMVNRYWLATGDEAYLHEFYPSVKAAMDFTIGMNNAPDGIIALPDHKVSQGGLDQWETLTFEFCEWHGYATMLAGIRLAQVKMVEQMAERVGDAEYAAQCREWYAIGAKTLEAKLWNERYYLNFYQPETGKRMDAIFGYQLDGQWMADYHGLPPVFPPERIVTTLQTIKDANVALTPYGAVNFANPDGTAMQPGQAFLHGGYQPYDFYPPEVAMLAMTYAYQGERDFALDLVRRCYENIFCKERMSWDVPNIINGETGRVKFGFDYYQNLILWALPAALDRQSIGEACREGGLVQRVIAAGAGNVASISTQGAI